MKKAFTLAEVLITLVVIGIVAALTIKIIIGNQDEAYRSALKKNFSAIQNAFRQATVDNGGYFPVSVYGDETTRIVIDNIFKKYMRVAMDCEQSNCFNGKTFTISNLIGNPTNTRFNQTYRSNSFILQDGSFYRVKCSGNSSDGGVNYVLGTVFIIVDVNGLSKGPNRWGKDVFQLYYNARREQLIPGGAPNTGWDKSDICDLSSNEAKNGIGCAARLLRGERLPR